jgi:hypothetical protein
MHATRAGVTTFAAWLTVCVGCVSPVVGELGKVDVGDGWDTKVSVTLQHIKSLLVNVAVINIQYLRC